MSTRARREQFIERYATFTALIRDRLTEKPPGTSARAIDLGYAFYVELPDGEQQGDLIGWLREMRATLAEHDFDTAAMLTHGSCWVDEQIHGRYRRLRHREAVSRVAAQRAPASLAVAEAATHGDEELSIEGWGPGLYLDLEAVEGVGPKAQEYADDLAQRGGAEFFRAGS